MAKKKTSKRGPKGLNDEQDRVVQLAFYTKRRIIDKHGGADEAKAKCKKFLEEDND